jgi:hypothetical protein
MTISVEIIRMLQNHDEIDELCDLIHDEYNNPDDWGDIKHMPIDDTCMAMDLDDIKKIVNEYGVLEIMDLIKGIYGDELIISLLETTMDMRYRSLFYHILDEYIDYVKEEYNWGDTDDEEEEEEQVDSDTASDAETDEEN